MGGGLGAGEGSYWQWWPQDNQDNEDENHANEDNEDNNDNQDNDGIATENVHPDSVIQEICELWDWSHFLQLRTTIITCIVA